MTEIIPSVLSEALYTEQKKSFFPSWQQESINYLLIAARPLLLSIARLRETDFAKDIALLRKTLTQELHDFDSQAKQYHCQPRLILAARYCLCTALDEVILSNQWASESDWSQHTLLSLIHRETWGGERFFIILEKMCEHPHENIDLLELIYIILSLGFEGKYYNQDKNSREEIIFQLFQLMQRYRNYSPQPLSPSILANEISPTVSKQSWQSRWKFPLSILAILLGFGVLTNIAIYHATAKTLQELTDIAQIPKPVLMPVILPSENIKLPHHTHYKRHKRESIK